MRKLVLPLAAMMLVALSVKALAADNDKKEGEKGEKITGILIDSHCAEKFKDKDDAEKAAAKHPAACALKCAKGGADLLLIHGKDQLKLDKHGQELAMDYLKEKDPKTKVTITGEKEGDELKVEKIAAAEEKEDK